MVKFVVFCTKIIAATIAATLFSSCHVRDIHFGDGIDGNGNVKTEKRNVEGNFTKVEISRGMNVTLEQADTYFVEVEADQNLQEHITTKVENGTLFISSDENIDEATAKNVYVKLPSLTAIETTSGSSVKTKNTFSGTDIDVKTSSGSETNLNLEYDAIKCESTSGSTLNVIGKALRLNTHSSSGSTIDAKELLVNEVVSESTSGSSTDVHPLVSLNAKASSGSSIDYDSSPKTVSKEESSGGSVSKE
ncbi:head GIN domain-containing protein [Flavobacterium paronense]|uniref:Head GIN domain-containing protein n=1 Tax=Flavobacterium paronense TaxID=1392775 RepID=A0ABV5GB74_9FLAO|nr:head GIN domain-containing protein [Flavobacterium paronense]MDN3676874.1 head GIN domain-containing protein [Flavobacterium paronense]